MEDVMQELQWGIDYSSSHYAIRPDFAESHRRFWERLASPGSWWTSAERIAIAEEVRAAWDCPLNQARREALSPNAGPKEYSRVSDVLPDVAVEAIHRITTDANRLTKDWYLSLLERGLSEGQYIEIVGTIVSMVSIDSFCIAMGLPLNALPEPGPGEPNRYRPSKAGPDDAWVPMVDADNSESAESDLWVANQTGNVVRAMSLVPEEVRTLKDLSAAHYLAMPDVRKHGYNAGRALSRTQMELVAGRTSALNACYY